MASTSTCVHPVLGAIRGVLSTPNILQLHNLPYGTIKQRFSRSTLLDKLPTTGGKEPYDGTRLPPASIQIEGAPESDVNGFQCPTDILEGYNEEQSEDCLRLDITLPKDTKSDAKLPVLIFIHGGAYFIGSGSRPYYSPLNFVKQAISSSSPLIYVSLQYRLGGLGFFHSPSASDLIPANNGLHDQLIAFQWIAKNIQGFGGDLDNITAIGQSAGGESVSLHNLAGYQVDNIWKKSIAYSGSLVTMPGNTPEEHEENFRSQAKKLGIDTSNGRSSEEIAKEMIEVDVGEIRKLAYVGQPCSQTEILPYEKPTMALTRERTPQSKKLKSQIVSSTGYDGGISYLMMIKDDSRKNHASAIIKIAQDVLSYPEELLSIYSITSSDSDSDALLKICAFESDIGFFAASLSLAQGWPGRTYLILFDLGVPFPGPLPGKEYAVHTWDIISLLGAYEHKLDSEYAPIIKEYRQKILDYVTKDEEICPAWSEEEGHALIVDRKGVRVVKKEEYMGPKTRRGKLLALAEKERGKYGADVLWNDVCRRFLMKGE